MNTVLVDGKTVAPSKIVCIGRNYVAHIEELGNEVPEEMVVFNKPNSAIGETLHARSGGETLHYEGEIALLVQQGRAVAAGFGLDLTRRQLQARLKAKGLPWERAKAFDGAALFSPFTRLENGTDTLSLRLHINGALRQHGGVELMLYPPDVILGELARFTTLEDGDIIMTGTPAGVGEVKPQDRFAGEVLCGDQVITSGTWQAE